MKTYTSHNTKLVKEDSWATKSKKQHVVIDDQKNGYAFVIKFGKSPKVSIWSAKPNGDLIEKLTITKPLKKTSKG
jgi:hypothetical protein